MQINKKYVANFIVVVGLLATYTTFFGYLSMHRYFEKGINLITHEHEDTESSIPPPGKYNIYLDFYIEEFPFVVIFVTIVSNPLNYWGGWKVSEHIPLYICSNKTGELYFQCIEKNAFYSIDEIITLDNISQNHFNNHSIYTTNIYGLAYYLHYNNTKIVPASSWEEVYNSPKFELNSEMWYYITIFDPKLSYFSFNPDTIPRL